MVEAGGGARLLVEALFVAVGAVALERHVDRLHRYHALERRIGRLVDDAHGAPPQLGLDGVAAELRVIHQRRRDYRPALTDLNTGPQIGCPASAGAGARPCATESPCRSSSRQRVPAGPGPA